MTDVAENLGSASAPRITKPTERPRKPARGRVASRLRRIGAGGFFLFVVVVLYAGWVDRGEKHLTAESGLGYALGIVGAVMMLLLLLYPVRKKLKFMARWGRTRYWFQAHMLLGVIGPVLILFHANFGLGSMNSSITLVSMLLVVASGLMGRYIYGKIHYGLYGRRASLRELHHDVANNQDAPGLDMDSALRLRECLQAFEAKWLAPPHGVLHSTWRLMTIGVETHWMHFRLSRMLKKILKVETNRGNWDGRTRCQRAEAARLYISAYLATIRKIAEFGFYERLFAVWHVLHLPLFVFLVLATIAHIVAVHLY